MGQGRSNLIWVVLTAYDVAVHKTRLRPYSPDYSLPQSPTGLRDKVGGQDTDRHSPEVATLGLWSRNHQYGSFPKGRLAKIWAIRTNCPEVPALAGEFTRAGRQPLLDLVGPHGDVAET